MVAQHYCDAMTSFDHNGSRLAFRFTGGDGPVLVFLPGYMSDMSGSKATALFDWAVARGRACLLLDYSGCGASGGDFLQGSIGRWTGDARAVLARVAPGARVVLVGSSMGGWIALHAGVMLGARLAGLVLVAAAPDFPDWGLEIAPDEAAALAVKGHFSRPSGYGGDYLYSRVFLDDAAACRMLGGAIAITAPVRLLHGQRDDAVPWRLSLDIAERLASDDVQAVLIKNGDHRLSRETDIARLLALVDEL
ncbi:2-hydroxymuconic semialdehyde hydrolase [Polymorphobacter multimanifer]|nr:2-hydroxymuconic semialdehyde hydrolase [Polymorphobacter multimanifer]